MLNFLDFESYKKLWSVVIINPITREDVEIVNDKKALEDYYEKHKDEIFIGYNISGYDQYVFKAILCDFDPYKVTKHIIIDKKKGYTFSKLFNKIPLNIFDTQNKFNSLKQLEGFMGNDIRETEIPFDYEGDFTPEMIKQVLKYNRHDVEQTIEVFLQRKNMFDAQMALVKKFNLPLDHIGKTQAQLASIVLGARKQTFNDEWDIRLPETLQLKKYKFIADWFMNPANYSADINLNCTIAGVEHVIAWGGLHGAIDKYIYECNDDELFVMADVDQLYPTIMIKYKLLSRAVEDYDKFENILSESLRLKALKMKKEREPYKLICNITYGAEGDRFNQMYDPLHRTLVCVYGQVLMIDLIEKIESIPGFKLIQSNTDGILIKIPKKHFELLDDLVYDWEQRTGLHMSFDCYKKVVQGDVNNYLVVPHGPLYDKKGKPTWKAKGAYVKELSPLDNDLPIVNKAIVENILKGVSVEDTINGCNDLLQFQKIVRLSGKYAHAWHNGKILNDKTFRVFASKELKDSYIGKQKTEGATIEKFANTPLCAFIDNSDVKGKEVPANLDRLWYINLAKKRLEDKFNIIT